MYLGKNIEKNLNTGSTFFVQFFSPVFSQFYFSLLLEVELGITKKLCQGWVRVVIQIGLFFGKMYLGKTLGKFSILGPLFLSNFFPQFFRFLFFTFIGGRVKSCKKVM